LSALFTVGQEHLHLEGPALPDPGGIHALGLARSANFGGQR
jgi:hypothetical protein